MQSLLVLQLLVSSLYGGTAIVNNSSTKFAADTPGVSIGYNIVTDNVNNEARIKTIGYEYLKFEFNIFYIIMYELICF